MNEIERIIENDLIPIVMDLVHEYGKFESIPGNVFTKAVVKAIDQCVNENYTKNTNKKYSDCCNYEIYEKPNSWKEYCSSCNESCGTLKEGKK